MTQLIIAYLVGYAVFATSAICVWGFIYRPHARATSGGSWSNREIVKFAFIQALAWPILAAVYPVGIALVTLIWAVDEGFEIGAGKIAKLLPDEGQYPGLRRKARSEDRYR